MKISLGALIELLNRYRKNMDRSVLLDSKLSLDELLKIINDNQMKGCDIQYEQRVLSKV